ncbi:MAG: hypothetical protein M3003_05565 [Candidatus Dormibacteraeota bacterium]|nr:hypothetical protein [Candidatus Dormibacteraeota bacterium]
MVDKEAEGPTQPEGIDVLQDGTLQKHLANWAEILDRWVTMELGKVNGEAAALDGREPAGKADAGETATDDSD